MGDRTRREALATLAALTGLTGCVGGPADDRTGSPHDSPTVPPGTGHPATPEPVDLDEEATRWAVRFDGPVNDTPTVADGTVYAATSWSEFGTPEPGADESWTLATLDGEDGTAEWTHELPGPTFGSPVVAAGGVYVPTGFSNGLSGVGQRLTKVADGARRWATDPGSGFHHLLAVDGDGQAYVGTGDDAIGTGGERLFGVDGEDGSRAWEVESGDPSGGRTVEGGLLVDVGGMVLDRHDPGDGTRRWRSECRVQTEPDGTIPTVDGVVPVELRDGDDVTFAALSLDDGSVQWRFDGDGEDQFVPTGATVVPEIRVGTQWDSLLVGTEYDGTVFALSPVDGGVLWRFDTDGDTRDGAVADGERVFVGDLAGTVYAIDARDGSELWRAALGEPTGWLAVTGETVVVGSTKGPDNLVGFARSDGRRLWSFESDEDLTRPALADGTIVVGSASGLVRGLGA
jgi:outer membrane protein assembly factor BamB